MSLTEHALVIKPVVLLIFLSIAASPLSALSPWFCRGSPCPSYKLESKETGYEIRIYDKASWVAINVTGVGRRVELAVAKAAVPLGRYVRGYNQEETPVAAGKPTLIAVRPVDKFTDCKDNFTVVYFLPDVTQKTAPEPNNPNISVLSSPGDAQLYIYQFGGFAKTESILSSAAKLATMLEADNLPYEQGSFYAALYDGLLPPPFTNRHNEIWMASHWDDDGESITAQGVATVS